MATHIVQEGEDLQSIARKYLGDGRLWRELGYQGNPETFKPGDEIHLPIDGPRRQPPLIQPLYKQKHFG